MIVSELVLALLALFLLPISHAAADLIDKLVDHVDPAMLYLPFEFIGDGSSGRVYRAHVKEAARDVIPALGGESIVAVKMIPLRNCKAENVAREVAILKSMKAHPGILKYLSSHIVNAQFKLEGEEGISAVTHGEGDESVVTQYVWITTSWIDGSNLSQTVDDHASAVRVGDIPSSSAYESTQVRIVGRALFGTLAHLHAQNILHGDMDISNVIIVDGSKPVLLDMGNADHDPSRLWEDIIRLVYALVEMSIKPIIYPDAFDDGPVNIKSYDQVRKVAFLIFLEEVCQKKWDIPEDLYELVAYVMGLPELTVEAVMKHPYIVPS